MIGHFLFLKQPLFYQPLPFYGKKSDRPFFWENSKIQTPFVKGRTVGIPTILEPCIHTFLQNGYCVRISVNFYQHIRKGVDIIFKLKAFNLAIQTPPRMLSWCPQIFKAADFLASSNTWFKCRGKNSKHGFIYGNFRLLNSCFQTHRRYT